jgi:hypothetical protein
MEVGRVLVLRPVADPVSCSSIQSWRLSKARSGIRARIFCDHAIGTEFTDEGPAEFTQRLIIKGLGVILYDTGMRQAMLDAQYALAGSCL